MTVRFKATSLELEAGPVRGVFVPYPVSTVARNGLYSHHQEAGPLLERP